MEYKAQTFELPEIAGISKEQIELHLGLYKGYVTHVNLLMSQMNGLAKQGDEFAYALAELRRRLGFEWNGMRLHELYFGAIENKPSVLLGNTKLYSALAKQYGSFSNWLEIYTKVSARGPGWALLNYDPVAKYFFHTWVAEHEIGQLATLPCLIALDHWEHAFLHDYKPSEKANYIQAYITSLNWELISKRFDAVV